MRSVHSLRRASRRGRVSTGQRRQARRGPARGILFAAGHAAVCAEWLEPRLLMAAHTWIGGQPAGLNQLWSFGPNWTSGVAPGATEADVTLVFPAFGIQKVLIDDIFSLSQVDSITFTGSGYIIAGNNSTIHLNSQGATYNIDDQAGGNVLGDAGLTIAMTPSEFVRVQAGRLNINAKLTNDGASIGSLFKFGTGGILQLGGSSSNSYTGTTVVDEGTLELNNSTSVCFGGDLIVGDSAGGAQADYLHVLHNGNFAGTTNVTINNSGWLDMTASLAACANLTMNGGLLSSTTGQLTLNGTLTATSTALGSASITSKFRMSPVTHVFQIDDGPQFTDLEISAVLGETGLSAGFTKFGNGRLTLSGNNSNTYTGTTTIYTGQLDLAKTNDGAIPGNLVIGDGIGGANADVVTQMFYGELQPTSNVTVNSSGLYDFNGQGDSFSDLTINDGNVLSIFTCGNLFMTGGTINTGTLAMFMYGTLTAVSDSSQIPTINGILNLDFGNRTLTVNSGPQAYDLIMNASIAGNGGITKNGAGLLNLTSSNSFTGGVVVTEGLLVLSNNLALSDTSSGTSVTGTGAIQLNGVHIPAEPLVISTSGAPYAGSVNVAATSIWDGPVTLSVNTILNVGPGSLTLNGAIGDGVFGGTDGLTKVGTGTLQLFGSAANTYGGTTTVNQGTLETNKPNVVAIPHDLVIGDNIGRAGADLVHTLNNRNLGPFSTVTVNSSGRLIMDRTEDIGTLNIADGGTAFMSTTLVGTSVLALRTSMSIAPTGRFDMADNSMIWDYTGSSPAAFARSLLTTGYAAGAWTGNGIRSSTAAATPGTSVGYAESSAISSFFPWNFQGFGVDNTAILFRYTLIGDSNLDNGVSLTDFTFMAANFNGASKNWVQGDYNYDNKVDLTDFTFLASNFNRNVVYPAADVVPLAAAQPLALPAASRPAAAAREPLWSEQLLSTGDDADLGG